MIKPLVSVIIPVFNSSATLKLCIDSLFGQDYPRKKIQIVPVDNNSTDDSSQIIRSYGLPYFFEAAAGPSAARNRGIKNAGGEYLLFIDSDCIADACLVSTYISLFNGYSIKDRRRTVLGGSIDGYNLNFWAKCDDICSWLTNNSRLPPRKEKRYLPTANLCVPKALIEKSVLFEEDMFFGEDYAFCHKLIGKGASLYFVPEAKVFHVNRTTFSGFMRHAREWTSGEYKLQEKEIIKRKNNSLIIQIAYYCVYFILKLCEVGYYSLISKKFSNIFFIPFIFLHRFYYCFCRLREQLKAKELLKNKRREKKRWPFIKTRVFSFFRGSKQNGVSS